MSFQRVRVREFPQNLSFKYNLINPKTSLQNVICQNVSDEIISAQISIRVWGKQVAYIEHADGGEEKIFAGSKTPVLVDEIVEFFYFGPTRTSVVSSGDFNILDLGWRINRKSKYNKADPNNVTFKNWFFNLFKFK